MAIRLLNYMHLVLVAMLCVGCTGEPDAGVRPSPEPAGEPVAESSVVDLHPVDYEGLRQFVQHHEGRPVVLDVWSTSCEPCIKELPNLARMQDAYQGRDVVFATLNIDYTGAAGTSPEDAQERARPVLEALGVAAQNFYSTTPDTELFGQALFTENGVYAIPAIFVFDRSGEVAETFGEAKEGTSPYDEVRSTVDALLEPEQPTG